MRKFVVKIIRILNVFNFPVNFFIQQHQNAKSENFIYLFCLLFNLLSLFVYCYYGNQASDCLEEIATLLYFFKWYRENVKLQKFISILMANAQRPRHYHGFGVIFLTLDTFTNVGALEHDENPLTSQ